MSMNKQEGNPEYTTELAGPLRRPAGIARLFVDFKRTHKKGTAGDDHDERKRQQKKCMTDNVDAVSHLLGQEIVDDVDADMFVVEQRPWRAQQENHAEQHPLKLKPGIGRHVETLAHDRIERGPHHREQDQPCQTLARPPRERVDTAAHVQERLQGWSSTVVLLLSWLHRSGTVAYPARLA